MEWVALVEQQFVFISEKALFAEVIRPPMFEHVHFVKLNKKYSIAAHGENIKVN